MTSAEFPDEVAKLCYDRFKSLSKKGKPHINKEWTLLASIVISREYSKNDLQIASLTTGTKCLGYSQLNKEGSLLLDSHAEVLARRGLIWFLFHHMHLLLNKKTSDILHFNEVLKKFKLKSGIKFHLFVSHTPCGDASIFPKEESSSEGLVCTEVCNDDSFSERDPKRFKRDLENETNQISSPSGLISASIKDIYRTGAKCVPGETQDPKESGPNFHVVGALRTKPGRGDPTWSMSCSDKMALWNVCGLQGALVSLLLEDPLYLTSLVIGNCPFDSKAVERAVIHRLSNITSLPSGYSLKEPFICQSSLTFECSKEKVLKFNPLLVPCSSSIIWCDVPDFLEVSVNGRKQGITKKNQHRPSSRISLCKSKLFERFLEINTLISSNVAKATTDVEENKTYLDYKREAISYQEAKSAVLRIFDKWKRKPEHLQNFTVSVKTSN